MTSRAITKQIKDILPELEEKAKYDIAERIVEVLREEIYPPESELRRDFLNSVKEARSRVKKGKAKAYKYEEFRKRFSDG